MSKKIQFPSLIRMGPIVAFNDEDALFYYSTIPPGWLGTKKLNKCFSIRILNRDHLANPPNFKKSNLTMNRPMVYDQKTKLPMGGNNSRLRQQFIDKFNLDLEVDLQNLTQYQYPLNDIVPVQVQQDLIENVDRDYDLLKNLQTNMSREWTSAGADSSPSYQFMINRYGASLETFAFLLEKHEDVANFHNLDITALDENAFMETDGDNINRQLAELRLKCYRSAELFGIISGLSEQEVLTDDDADGNLLALRKAVEVVMQSYAIDRELIETTIRGLSPEDLSQSEQELFDKIELSENGRRYNKSELMKVIKSAKTNALQAGKFDKYIEELTSFKLTTQVEKKQQVAPKLNHPAIITDQTKTTYTKFELLSWIIGTAQDIAKISEKIDEVANYADQNWEILSKVKYSGLGFLKCEDNGNLIIIKLHMSLVRYNPLKELLSVDIEKGRQLVHLSTATLMKQIKTATVYPALVFNDKLTTCKISGSLKEGYKFMVGDKEIVGPWNKISSEFRKKLEYSLFYGLRQLFVIPKGELFIFGQFFVSLFVQTELIQELKSSTFALDCIVPVMDQNDYKHLLTTDYTVYEKFIKNQYPSLIDTQLNTFLLLEQAIQIPESDNNEFYKLDLPEVSDVQFGDIDIKLGNQ